MNVFSRSEHVVTKFMLKKVVEDFSKSKQKFRETFRETYGRLQVLGGNYRGAAAFLDDTADLKNN